MSIQFKYIFYEQFGTGKSIFQLANAFLMILISAVPTLIMVFKYNLKNQKSVGRKLIYILLFGFPTFFLYILRFYKGLVSNSKDSLFSRYFCTCFDRISNQV